MDQHIIEDYIKKPTITATQSSTQSSKQPNLKQPNLIKFIDHVFTNLGKLYSTCENV